jgi:predicted DCC family thiol-disulfide oxidoreductase YuxK
MNASPQVAMPAPGQESFTSPEHPFLLFFDGECSFCNRWVARVKNADRSHRTRFATKQGPTFQRVARAHPEVADVESVVLITRLANGQEDFLVKTPAIRTLIEGLSGFGLFSWVLHVVPTPISNLGYLMVAKLREPLFSRWHNLRVPIEQDRELFLD